MLLERARLEDTQRHVNRDNDPSARSNVSCYLKGCTATVSSVAVTVTIDTDWRVIGVTCQSEN